MSKKKMNLQKQKYSFIALACVSGLCMVMILGLSYAFLSQVLKGEKENTVTAGTLAIEYKDKKTINLDNAYPMSDQRGMMTESYQFSVENTGDIKALYDISLEEDQSTMNHSYLKYALKRNNEEWSEPKVLDSLKLREQIELEVGSKDNYELKLWMDEKVGNEGQNKIFKARVVISSVQMNATTNDVVSPVIKLKGSLSESIEQNKEYTDPGVDSVEDDKDTLNKEDVVVTYEYYDGENSTEVENIDTSKLGVYYITYQITDKNGNIGKVIRSVNIYKKNTTPPVMKLNGKNLMAIKIGEEYTELGASATSGEEDLTNRVVTVGKVNNKKAGSYEIKYLITDHDGNTASIVRIVNVIHINSDFKADVTLDLTNKPTDKIKLEGENLGDITYTSSDPDIVTVDDDGNVIGKNPGTATITIKTSTGHEETITITVQKTITATFVKQGTGVTNIEDSSRSCSITKKDESCNITLPNITVESGYTVVGWSAYQDATKGIAVNETITLTEDKTYYSISYKNAITRTVTYEKTTGVSAIGKTNDSCTIEKVFNNEIQATTCSVSLPTITSLTGYDAGFWSTSSTASSGTAAGTSISLSDNTTYYARALDTTKPIWSLVSVTPSSGSADTVTITFKGTDTSGSVTSTLTASNITVKVGGTTVGPTIKTLSSATNVTNGKQYTLELSNFSSTGILSIMIASSTLKDGSNNMNNTATFTTGVTVTLIKDLYKKIAEKAVLDNTKSEFVSNSTEINFGEVSSDTNGKRVYTFASTKNDKYPVHYYRGAVTDNNVKFGGFCWKIVRTTETGGVKLIYNGSPDANGQCTNTTGEATQIGTSAFNYGSYYTEYIEYMIDNTTDSTVKGVIDTWYQTNMENYTSKLEDTIWCNDQNIARTEENYIYQGSYDTYYAAYDRVHEIRKADLNCSDRSYMFTVNEENGNGLLTYPVGMLTADETMLAGATNTANSNYYLYTKKDWWTLSPSNHNFTDMAAFVFFINFDSKLLDGNGANYGVRPSISLAPNTKITSGDGSSSRPFVIN